jgi:hypothetical protein
MYNVSREMKTLIKSKKAILETEGRITEMKNAFLSSSSVTDTAKDRLNELK